ncbi:hypothetical protein GCM10009087_18040 [Sphingomonas oligophenolica]|uniref:Rod shape-determining protein MreD n=1 Tax=Sphingomonas oligophenolica TaxID=301154 RepID=A0ABU9Y3F5_9SPHN
MLYLLYYGFWAILVAFAVWSCLAGAADERWAAAMMCVAALLTRIVGDAFNTHWHRPQLGVLAVDIGLLFGLVVLALRSRRFWPLTVASVQLIAVLTHPALWIDPAILPFGYALMQGFWAYPMMLVVAIGAWRHVRRQGRHEHAPEHAGVLAATPRSDRG